MQSNINLKKEIFTKIENKSKEKGISFDDLVNELLEHGLKYSDEEDKIFEQRTRDALERVESRGIKGKPASEFLKEMESW